jgi:hypothetical protein
MCLLELGQGGGPDLVDTLRGARATDVGRAHIDQPVGDCGAQDGPQQAVGVCPLGGCLLAESAVPLADIDVIGSVPNRLSRWRSSRLR